METIIADKNPQKLIKAFNKGTFVCLAKAGMKHYELKFNQNMIAAGTVSQLKKLSAIAYEKSLTSEFIVYHVCGGKYHYEYNF